MISIELDPTLETRLHQEARRLGLTESAFIRDLLERSLSLSNPADLLRRVRSNTPMGDPEASENVSDKIRAKLSAQPVGAMVGWMQRYTELNKQAGNGFGGCVVMLVGESNRDF